MTTTTCKRLLLILGGKGGTGKTLFCRLFYYFAVKAGLNCLGYDADIENPEFYQYHAQSAHKVQALDFLNVAKAKQLLSELNQSSSEIVILDMPGASGQATRDQITRFGLFNIAKDLGYRVTIVSVLNNAYNTINSLEMMMAFAEEAADYVAVKSQLWNEGSLNFARWENSDTRKAFVELKGIEIEMPVLEVSTFDALHEGEVSFFDLDRVSFGDRILAESFLDLSKPQIELAAAYFGLPIPTETVPNGSKRNAKRREKSNKSEGNGVTDKHIETSLCSNS